MYYKIEGSSCLRIIIYNQWDYYGSEDEWDDFHRPMSAIEKTFADRLSEEHILFKPQYPVGIIDSYCSSRFPCKCGQAWSDDETGYYEAESSFKEPDDCTWYRPSHPQYFLDFFIPVGDGLVVEIDDWGTHSSPEAVAKDFVRQKGIEKEYGFKFLRFTATDVHNRLGKCMKGLRETIAELCLRPQQIPLL